MFFTKIYHMSKVANFEFRNKKLQDSHGTITSAKNFLLPFLHLSDLSDNLATNVAV